jgi:predicted RNase H-like nuclease
LANPHFADGGRARRISRRLGLDTRLEDVGPRRAIEVYPHAALVSLFDLPTVLRYKRGRGRSVADRLIELLRLVELIETLRTADPALQVEANGEWAATRRSVIGATRPMHLNDVEDAMDAVVCAYVALLALQAPTRVEAFGSEADGAIIVPRPALT